MSAGLTCSTCDKPAVYVVDGADPQKGNRSCDDCRSFWPLSTFTRIKAEP